MKYKIEGFFCNKEELKKQPEIKEMLKGLSSIEFNDSSENDEPIIEILKKSTLDVFKSNQWSSQQEVNDTSELNIDFEKNDNLALVEFGKKATLYRDYYKFQLGYQKEIMKQAILIVLNNPEKFISAESGIIPNTLDYKTVYNYLCQMLLPIPVLLIGLIIE